LTETEYRFVTVSAMIPEVMGRVVGDTEPLDDLA